MEVFWTGLGSLISGNLQLIGTTNMWMFLIYGLAIFMEPIEDLIGVWPIVLRGGVYTLLIFTAEYLTGWFLQILIGSCPWYYNDFLNINGLITLKYAPVWFVVGLLFERVHCLLSRVYIKD